MLERQANLERRASERARSGLGAPWRREGEAQGRAHDLTYFWEPEGARYLSLENLLREAREAGRTVETVRYYIGAVHVGSWRRLKRVFGESVVVMMDEDEEVACRVPLRTWCDTQARMRGEGEIEVKDVKKAELLSEKMFILKHQLEDGLRTVSYTHLTLPTTPYV